MTNEEAKALFEEDLKDGKCSNDCPECNAREKAISALEKQMPQKPTIDEYDDGTYSYICPCGAEVEENQVYCDICGQALDWGEEEEG